MENNINKIIEELLNSFKEGRTNKEEVILKVKEMYFEDIGFAKIDHHRLLRRDFPEVIYGAGKTPEQILEIAKKILNYSPILLVTRTTVETYCILKKEMYTHESIKKFMLRKNNRIDLISQILTFFMSFHHPTYWLFLKTQQI